MGEQFACQNPSQCVINLKERLCQQFYNVQIMIVLGQ